MSSNPSPTRAKSAAIYRRSHATTESGSGIGGIAVAVLFHGLIFAAAYLTLPRDLSTPEESNVVPVDLVTIADVTNVAAQAPPAPEPEKLEIPVPAAAPPPEPEMVQVEPAPEPPLPKFDIQKEVKKPVEKPAPPKKSAAQDFDALLNRLTTPEKPARAAKPADRVIAGAGAGTGMTASIADALKSQIYRCWSPPTGLSQSRLNELVVEFDISFNPNGTVANATSPSVNPGNPNSYNLAAGIAARNAIYECQPYRLPADRYNVWRQINMRFDPRLMQ